MKGCLGYILTLCSWVLRLFYSVRRLWSPEALACDILPKLHSRESTLAKHLVRRRGLLNRPFRPPFLLRGPFVQTLLGLFCPPLGDLNFEREYLHVDKGIVALDWYTEPDSKLRRNSPILLVFPRLTGDALSVGGLCRLANKRGFRPVVFNRRGHGMSFLTTPKLTSTGDPNDAREVIGYIFEKYPYVPLVGVGVGAGCATLFSYLGESGSSSQLKAAVCISPSYDNTIKLCEQIPKFYELIVLVQLKAMLIVYWKVLHKVIDLKAVILKCWTLKEFDFHVYCKMYGIATFDTFWQRNDPMRDVDDIAVPVLCVNSVDDPVSVHENIPLDVFRYYPNLLLVTLAAGGHCSFHENVTGDSWANGTALTFIEGVLEFISNSRYWYK
ncbi:protein ABHD15-like [Mya arenaria]|uniref:protein ABHD15-like n=1 Tax=Mya arenaria TaxID=6604 RepID=UPI0022E67DE4|nr:protein ABHD15-like [Mya arenaria]